MVSSAPERPRVRRAADASMDLLNQLQRQPMDPDYAVVAARDPAPTRTGARRRGWRLALVLVVVGALVAISGLETSRRAPQQESERQELIARIGTAEQQLDTARSQVTQLNAEIEKLRTAALGGDAAAQSAQQQILALEPAVGTVAVTGPGLVVTVDDAATGNTDRRDRVLDLDLQLLANGLWQAGAEAVAINGHRLSALTAIRGAGEAITVDYRSLTRPYVVQAIGDPQTLPARFAESSGGRWWHELAANRGMRFEVGGTERLTLPPDPGMVLRYASRQK